MSTAASERCSIKVTTRGQHRQLLIMEQHAVPSHIGSALPSQRVACEEGASGCYTMLRLQGLRPARFKPVAGARQSQINQMKHAVGNAMSGNVLHRVIARIAQSLGVDAKDEWSDPLHACIKLL